MINTQDASVGKVYTLADNEENVRRLGREEITSDEWKAAYEGLKASKEPILLVLGKMTIKELAMRGAGGDKKAPVIILAFYEDGHGEKAMGVAGGMVQTLLEEVRKSFLDWGGTQETYGEPNEPLPGYQYWEDHPKYTSADWRLNVEEENTRAGYWAWVKIRLTEDNASDGREKVDKQLPRGRRKDRKKLQRLNAHTQQDK